MRIFNKASVALIVALGFSTISVAEEERVMIHTTEGANATISVNIDGKETKVELLKEALHDKDKLAEALKDIPEDVREKLITTMTQLHVAKGDVAMQLHRIEVEEESDWVSNDGQKHIIVKIDSDSDVDFTKIIMKEDLHAADSGHEKIMIKHGSTLGADSIIRLLSHADLSAEDLDKIQAALDAKR